MSELLEGVVVKVYGLYYTVSVQSEKYNCMLRGKTRRDKKWINYTNPLAVGDNVLISINDDQTGNIEKILDRDNLFSRKDKGRNKKEDIIAANLDQIVVIQSFVDPMINLRFVDRIAVRGKFSQIPTICCVNKIDLASQEHVDYLYDYYRNAPIDVIMVSAKEKLGLNELKEKLKNQRSIFAGYSGVGKSTILNTLYSGLNLQTSNISEKTGKGKHTTTNVELVSVGDNTELVDTPGVREFGLMDIEPHMLGRYFYEFNKYIDGCSFSTCTHDHEPKCEVKRRVDCGDIYEGRYISYLNILYSIKEYYDNIYR
jgi:ribosome biogenesis GTPase